MEASLFVFMFVLLTVPFAVQSRSLYQPHYGQGDVFSLLDYGAIGDGVNDDTQAFQEAWNNVCNSSLPSAVLHVPRDKTFLLHPLVLEGPCRSNNVHIEILGNMLAPSDPSEWQCDYHEGTYNCASWLEFYHVNDLYITGSEGNGKGTFTIDGQGQNWWDLPCHRTSSCGRLPMMFKIRHSNNVHIRNINIINSPMMHILIEGSTWVYAHNLNITASKRSPNTDGIHIQQSQNVFVYDSNIGTGDDCVSIGGGSSHLYIENISCGPGHGISIGSLGGRGATETVEYIYVNNIKFSKTLNGVRIKTWQGGNGYARNIVFENIRSCGVIFPIIIDQHYCDPHTKHSCQKDEAPSAVKISNVTYNQVHGTSDRKIAIKFDCSEAVPCTDIILNDINIPSTRKHKTSAYCQNVYGRAQGQVIPRVPCLNHV